MVFYKKKSQQDFDPISKQKWNLEILNLRFVVVVFVGSNKTKKLSNFNLILT